jgi:hypothetical protein
MDTINQHRTREVRIIATAIAAIAAICPLSFTCAVIPGLEAIITTGLITTGVVVGLLLVLRAALRRMQWHFEERADVRIALVLQPQFVILVV